MCSQETRAEGRGQHGRGTCPPAAGPSGPCRAHGAHDARPHAARAVPDDEHVWDMKQDLEALPDEVPTRVEQPVVLVVENEVRPDRLRLQLPLQSLA